MIAGPPIPDLGALTCSIGADAAVVGVGSARGAFVTVLFGLFRGLAAGMAFGGCLFEIFTPLSDDSIYPSSRRDTPWSLDTS